MVASETLRAKVTWTYRDCRLMPNDGKRYEVLDGELCVTPAPTTTHQTVSKLLQTELVLQIERTGRGIVFGAPVDVIFSETRVAQPDLLVIDKERRAIISERGIEGPPDLIVEILSPSTQTTDRQVKLKLYAMEGVREYWIIDPASRQIEIFRLGAEGYELQNSHKPGERVESQVFALDLEVNAIFG